MDYWPSLHKNPLHLWSSHLMSLLSHLTKHRSNQVRKFVFHCATAVFLKQWNVYRLSRPLWNKSRREKVCDRLKSNTLYGIQHYLAASCIIFFFLWLWVYYEIEKTTDNSFAGMDAFLKVKFCITLTYWGTGLILSSLSTVSSPGFAEDLDYVSLILTSKHNWPKHFLISSD